MLRMSKYLASSVGRFSKMTRSGLERVDRSTFVGKIHFGIWSGFVVDETPSGSELMEVASIMVKCVPMGEWSKSFFWII